MAIFYVPFRGKAPSDELEPLSILTKKKNCIWEKSKGYFISRRKKKKKSLFHESMQIEQTKKKERNKRWEIPTHESKKKFFSERWKQQTKKNGLLLQ